MFLHFCAKKNNACGHTLRGKVIKASWLFCPAENTPQNGGVLPGTLGRTLAGYRPEPNRSVREKTHCRTEFVLPCNGYPWNICLVLPLFSPLCSSVGTSCPRQKREFVCLSQREQRSLSIYGIKSDRSVVNTVALCQQRQIII